MKTEIHVEDLGAVLSVLSLVGAATSSGIGQTIMLLVLLLSGVIIGLGLSDPQIVIDLSLLRKKHTEE